MLKKGAFMLVDELQKLAKYGIHSTYVKSYEETKAELIECASYGQCFHYFEINVLTDVIKNKLQREGLCVEDVPSIGKTEVSWMEGLGKMNENEIQICEHCGRKILTEYPECPWCIGPNLVNNYLKRELALTEELNRLLKELDDINDPTPECRVIFIYIKEGIFHPTSKEIDKIHVHMVDPIRNRPWQYFTIPLVFESDKKGNEHVIADYIKDLIPNNANPNLTILLIKNEYINPTLLADFLDLSGLKKHIIEVV